jgi:hypothetical protein
LTKGNCVAVTPMPFGGEASSRGGTGWRSARPCPSFWLGWSGRGTHIPVVGNRSILTVTLDTQMTERQCRSPGGHLRTPALILHSRVNVVGSRPSWVIERPVNGPRAKRLPLAFVPGDGRTAIRQYPPSPQDLPISFKRSKPISKNGQRIRPSGDTKNAEPSAFATKRVGTGIAPSLFSWSRMAFRLILA